MKTISLFSFLVLLGAVSALQTFAQDPAADDVAGEAARRRLAIANGANPAAPPAILLPPATATNPAPTGEAPPQPDAKPTLDAPPASDTDANDAVPQGFRDDRYEATFKKNPFMTRTPPPAGPAGPGLADDWELKGMVDRNGVQSVTLLNKKTAQYLRVGAEPDKKEGIRIVKMNQAATRKERTVEIAKGAETAILSFSDTPSPGGRPAGGMPGQQPNGQPRTPYNGNVAIPTPPGGIRPPGTALRPTATGAMPSNVPQQGQPNGLPPGVMPGGANVPPTNSGRRRLLVPTPTPASPNGAVPSPMTR